ncbi:translocation/assembly module TamB domain-containing protein [Aequorivita ciconiae]|uniref:translocation/assembly module TamB domain-containing protein n=1 Tax=Aequorivita ciconiae TaxID=2494375 RepID=UPI001F0C7FAF|nr:translocation/assembly module TamB [Aequorivita sp. H23M31]
MFLLILFVRSPWGQNIIVQRAVKYVSGKTHTRVEIDKLFITFDGNVMLKGLFLEDKKGDTLIYSKSLEADIPLLPLIRGNSFGIDNLYWEGLRANVIRKDSIDGYNFQFLIDAFVTPDTTTVAVDTTSSTMNLILGDFHFKDFNIVFDDAVLGIDSQFQIGSLNLQMKKTDLENMDFRASQATISNARIKYIQSPVPPQPKGDSPLPFLELDKIALKNVFLDYQSYGDRIAAEAEIADLYLEMKEADLANNTIDIGDFRLKNSIITLNTETEVNGITQKVEEVKDEAKEDIRNFEWPDFRIAISKIDMEGNNISYFVGKNEVKKNVFNPNAIALQNFNLQANNVFLKDKKAGLNLDELTFQEGSGFNLKQLTLNIDASDKYLDVDKIKLALNDNSLNGKVRFDYKSLADLIDKPEQSKIALDLPSFAVDLKEIFKFQPDLRKNEYLRTLSEKRLSGNVDASGYLSSISIPKLNVFWGNTTRISANGTIQNATNPENLKFNIPHFSAKTKRSDLVRFVSEKDLGVSLPEDVALEGHAKGNPEDIYAMANLTTSQGIAIIDGHFKNDSEIAFDADVEIKEYKINELLNNEEFGALSLSIKTQGSGKDINSLDATLDAKISSFQFRDYAIKDWEINGKIANGEGDIVSAYKDKNLDLAFNADIVLDSVSPKVSAHLDVKGVNLQAIGVMDRDVRTGLVLDADFEGSKEGFDIISTIGNGVVVYDNKTYLLGDVLATAHIRKDTTSIWVDNKILQLSLESNTDPETFGAAIKKHIASYFSKKVVLSDTVENPVKLKIIGRIAQAPVLNKVFLVNVNDLDTISIAAYFDQSERKLAAKIQAPHINYGGNELDSLAFTMDSDKDKFIFDLGFNSLKAGPLDVPKTKISGHQENEELNLAFTAIHKDSILININSQITGTSEELRFHVKPDSLILDRKKWETPENNEVLISRKKVAFNDFRFTRGDEKVELTDKMPDISRDHAAIEFQNFKLSEILNYLNPEEELAKGNLNGNLALVEPYGKTGLLADLMIDKLEMLDIDLGRLTAKAESDGGDRYDFEMAMKEGEVDLDLKGDYIASETEGRQDLDLVINKFNMYALEGFSLGEVKNTGGSFSGKFNVTGTTKDPQYKGNLNFDNASFTISKLNAPFTLANESIKLDNSGIYMDGFTVRDENNNQLVLSGNIGTESFINPTFNLKLDAENFQLINATKEDNDMVYGRASFNADATLTGDLQIPKLDARLRLDDDTNITYVLPSASVAIEERDGIVIFVNREDPDAVLTRTEEKSAVLTGFDINAFLKIGKKAKITIVIDEETEDNFEVYGDGDFNFTMNPNGRISLTGVYDIAGGHYEMNLYSLVNRRFELAPGSRVSWSGDPFDAKLDVKAIYKVKTSASALMAPISSGADPSVKGKYRQVLPFYVYLNIDGELLKPKISFDLDMPENEQGAIGGQVYGRIQQVNQQTDELNRQVFSLLVLNRFYPDPGSDGSGGGFASVARDNLNDALSDQLNTFSDKILGNTGLELDFGLDSYTDYQGETPQERTQLDIAAQKKLFDDRVIVRVGSEVDLQGSSPTNEPTPIIGNISIEYLLTENGRYRLKGFHHNEFDNVIDGQTVVSGIALIFTQEFNKFNELWDALLHGQTKEEKEAIKEAKKEKRQKKKEEKREDEQKKLQRAQEGTRKTDEGN